MRSFTPALAGLCATTLLFLGASALNVTTEAAIEPELISSAEVDHVTSASVDFTTEASSSAYESSIAPNSSDSSNVPDKLAAVSKPGWSIVINGTVRVNLTASSMGFNSSEAQGVPVSGLAALSSLKGPGFRQTPCAPDELCRHIYNIIKTNFPTVVQDVLTTITMVPDIILEFALSQLLGESSVFITSFIKCWRCATTQTFGENPNVALAALQGAGPEREAITADVYFAQSLEREGHPKALSVVGRFSGLTPGQRYRVTVRRSGDIDDECRFVGDEFVPLGGAVFSALGDGSALLLLHDTSVLLDGRRSVLGRSLVLTAEGEDTVLACGAIARSERGHSF